MKHLLCARPWAAESKDTCPHRVLGSPNEPQACTSGGPPVGPEVSTPSLPTQRPLAPQPHPSPPAWLTLTRTVHTRKSFYQDPSIRTIISELDRVAEFLEVKMFSEKHQETLLLQCYPHNKEQHFH